MADSFADTLALPDAILSEDRDDPIWVVIIITNFAVERFELFDFFDVFQSLYPIC